MNYNPFCISSGSNLERKDYSCGHGTFKILEVKAYKVCRSKYRQPADKHVDRRTDTMSTIIQCMII